MPQRLIVTLRVKDASIFIHDWLKCYEKLADEIIVVDNGSTDGTYEILKAHPKVTAIERTEGFNEGRDFEILLNLLKQRRPDWVLTVDADEIFEERVTREHFERMMNRPWVSRYRFRRFHLFGDEHHYMAKRHNLFELVDFGDRSMYRFSDRLHVPLRKIHTTISGQSSLFIPSGLRIRHLCMLHIEYRKRAYETYMKVDEDASRRHMYERDVRDLEIPERVSVLPFWRNRLVICAEYTVLTTASVLFKLLRLAFRRFGRSSERR